MAFKQAQEHQNQPRNEGDMVKTRDARVHSEWGSDPEQDQTGPLVQGLVWQNPTFRVGSGSGFTLGWTCSGLGPNRTAPQTSSQSLVSHF
jgi:hypothetical protein